MAKDMLVDVRKRGANIEDVRPLLQESRNAMDKEDFKTAIEAAMKCRSQAMRKLEVLQNAYDAISAAATLVAEAKMKGINVRNIARTLIKAKDNFKERNYEEARKLAVSSRAEVEQMLLGVRAQEDLLRVKNLVSVGNEGGLDMANMFALLKEVEAAIAKNDAVAALSVIKSIDEELNKIFLAKADQILADISNIITEVEKSGISITGIKDMSVRASQAVIENEAFEAFHYADVAYKEVLRIKDISQKATAIIKASYERINEAEGYHGDASAAKAYLNQAVKFFKLGDFEKAHEFGQKSVEEAEIAEMRLLTRVISDVHSLIASAKKEGVNTALSENLLTRAKQSLDEKKYKDALNLAMKSESELERVGLQQEMASTTITVTETKIQKMKEEGFTCPEAEAIVAKAKEMFDAGDYIQALEMAIQASDALNRASEAFTDIKENFNLMRSAVELLEKCRIDTGNLQAESDVVAKNFKDGAYVQVKDAVTEILTKAKAIAEENSKSISSYCSWFIDFSGTLGVDTTDAKRFFDEGLMYFERKVVDKGMDQMRSIFQFLEPSVKDALALAITELSSKLSQLKSRNVSDPEAESLFEKAKVSVDTGRYKEAHEAILACISKIETILASIPPEVVVPAAPAEVAPREPAKDATSAPIISEDVAKTPTAPEPPKLDEELKRLKEEIKVGIEGCKKFGFNATPISEMLSKVNDLELEGKIEPALEKARKCSIELEKILAKVTPAVQTEASYLPDKIETGTPIDVTVRILNTAKAVAKDVSVEFEGGAELAGERSTISMMKGGAEETHKLSVRFTQSGDLEFKMKTTYHRIFDNKTFTHVADLKVTVKEPRVLDFVAAEVEKRCSMCKGKIKPGFLLFECECGYIYHEPCAIRATKCTSCGLDLPKKKGKSKLALTFG
jgi:tetratricopeptide (TPR) repeat protein